MPDVFVSPKPSAFKTGSLEQKKTSAFSHAFSSYLFLPTNVKFETQGPGETILLLLRKHWITNFTWLSASTIFIIMPLFLFPLLISGGFLPQQISYPYIILSIMIWYLVTFTYILINFLLWYFTVSIITNERVIDIDYVTILNKKFAATMISKIEDVTMRRGGFVQAIFNYGDVVIQTAAHEVQFGFLSVPQPEEVVRIVNQLMDREEDEGEGG